MFSNLWRYRHYIRRNTLRDLKERFAGSGLGLFWYVIHPLFLVLLYVMVFSRIMPVKLPRLSNESGFAIYLCTGLLPWISFSETLSRAAGGLVDNAGYLKKLAIPEEVFLNQIALSGLVTLFINIFVLFLLTLVLGHFPRLCWLYILPVLILLQGFAFSLGLIFAVINVFFRDVGQLLVLILQLWFWATPIVYTQEIIPAHLRWLLYCNPLYSYMEALHLIVVKRVAPGAETLLTMLLITVVFWFLAKCLLKRRRGELRDAL